MKQFASTLILCLSVVLSAVHCPAQDEDEGVGKEGGGKKAKLVTPAALVPPEAGSHGFVGVDPATQRLAFEDGTPASFYGVCFAGYLNEPDRKIPIEEMAKVLDDMRELGINVIRFQTYDNQIQKGVFGKGLNDVAMENRDRFIAEGKKRGIYFHMTLNVSSPARGGAAELLKAAGGGREMLILIDEFINYQKTYAVNLLSHVNPYTGLAYKDEPAIISLQLGNEQHAYSRPEWRDWTSIKEPAADELRGKWNKFLMDKYGSLEKLRASWKGLLKDGEDPARGTVAVSDVRYPTWDDKFVPNIREEDIILFGDAMQDRFYKEMRNCIRQTAGDTRHLISDNGWIRGDERICETAHRDLDLMDLQHYWPHGPRMRLTAEKRLNVSPIKDCGVNIISSMLTAREFQGEKKPGFVTEYNSHKDNASSFQLVPVHAAFSRLTGLDGVALWAYSRGDAEGLMNKDHWFSFNRDNVDIEKELIPFLVGAYLWRSSIPELMNRETVKSFARWDDGSQKGISVDYDASLQQAVSLQSFENKNEGVMIDFPQNRMVINRPDVFFFTGRGECHGTEFSFNPLQNEADYLLAVFPLDGKTLADATKWRVFSTMDGEARLSRTDLTNWTAYNRGYAMVKDASTKGKGGGGRKYERGGEIDKGVWSMRRVGNAVYFDVAKK